MNSFKKIITVAAIALASASAGAEEISAGGITWDSTSSENGIAGDFFFQQWFSESAYGVGTDGQKTIVTDDASAELGLGALTGVGEFYRLSSGRLFDANEAVRACDTCELTYAFGGLVIESVVGDITTFNTDNAWLNVYIDDQNDLVDLWELLGTDTLTEQYSGTVGNFDALADDSHTQFSAAQDGLLWASFEFDSFEVVGSLIGGFSNAELSVIGGMADVVAALDYQEALSDIKFTASAGFDGGSKYSESNGQLVNVVPEPTSIALFGFALFGLAGAARRKAK